MARVGGVAVVPTDEPAAFIGQGSDGCQAAVGITTATADCAHCWVGTGDADGVGGQRVDGYGQGVDSHVAQAAEIAMVNKSDADMASGIGVEWQGYGGPAAWVGRKVVVYVVYRVGEAVVPGVARGADQYGKLGEILCL